MSMRRNIAERPPGLKRRPAFPVRPRTVLAVFLFLLPYAVSSGSDGARFTLINRTDYFLHAVIDNETFVYIPPGVSITRQTSGLYSVSAEVTYSPGQGKTGSASRIFETVVHSTQSGSSAQRNDCSNSQNDCESTSSSTSSSTTSVDPIRWVVTADTLVQ